MTDTGPINTGLREFYTQTTTATSTEKPTVTFPAYGDLDPEQRRAWVLAYAATLEYAVRLGEAIGSVVDL